MEWFGFISGSIGTNMPQHVAGHAHISEDILISVLTFLDWSAQNPPDPVYIVEKAVWNNGWRTSKTKGVNLVHSWSDSVIQILEYQQHMNHKLPPRKHSRLQVIRMFGWFLYAMDNNQCGNFDQGPASSCVWFLGNCVQININCFRALNHNAPLNHL